MRERRAQPPLTAHPNAPASETVLAFDFGVKRIGVAVGETLIGSARSLATVGGSSNDMRFSAIGRLIEQWQPCRLVVGLPRNENGSEHALSARCRRFANQLHGRFGLPVTLVDERYTSFEADTALKQDGANWQDRKAAVDAYAAQVILQSYFLERNGTPKS